MIFNIGVGMKNVTATLDSSLPADVTVTSGTEATFSVLVTDAGVPKDHTFQWYVNDAAIEGATKDTYVRDTSGDKGVISVWCGVTNKAGTAVSRKANLTVKKLPVLNENYPANASVTIGKTAEFKVTVSEDGYPGEYSYQWYVNEKAVEGATKATYTRTAPAVGTEKVYCVVTNGAGSVKSREATHTVGAEYVFSNGTFQNGNSYDWTSNSDIAGCDLTNGWHLYVDGSNHWGAAWATVPINLTGKNKLIFTVSATDTTGYGDTGTGYARLGVADGSNLGNTTMVAEVVFRMDDNFNSRDFVVDVSNLSGEYLVKIVVDRTNITYDEDHIYVSAVRFE